MLRPAIKTKTASAPAHSFRQTGAESPRVGPLPEQGVSLEDGVPRASPARSGSLRIAPTLSPAPVPPAPPGPPRSRPASCACRFQRTQELPRRPDWTPRPPARDPRRILIPTRVPPRGLDTRRLREPPTLPPPLPPPPLARRGGEGMERRSRLRSAPAPPPLSLAPPRSPALLSPERHATPRLQPQGPASPATSAQDFLLTPSAGLAAARPVPGTLPWMGALRPRSRRQGLSVTMHARSSPEFLFLKFGGAKE